MSATAETPGPEEATSSDRVPEYLTVEAKRLDRRYAELRLVQPEATSMLERSIARHGVLHPLVVNQLDDGTLVVLDGFKRLSAVDEDAALPVRVVTLAEPQAKAALLTYNRPHRGLCELEEAWVVQSLVRDHNLLQYDVAELLGRHKSWVCRRLQLAERLDADVVEDMKLGLVSASVARELVKLPRGNQAAAADAVQEHGLTSRQTSELVGRLLEAEDDNGRRELLDDPLRFLTSAPVPLSKRDARLSTAGNQIQRSLERLTRQAVSTDRLLRVATEGFVHSDVDVLGPTFDKLKAALRAVLSTVVELTANEADSGDP